MINSFTGLPGMSTWSQKGKAITWVKLGSHGHTENIVVTHRINVHVAFAILLTVGQQESSMLSVPRD
jgi:hypothetical protein